MAVLPLQDPGEFHGACWNIDGRIVIVLKQLTPSSSRWAFDLAHEVAHVARHLDASTTAIIEALETTPTPTPNEDDDETEASDFAAELLLGDADALARILAERTGGRLQRLKSEVLKLADETNVEPDALASYMAYRLTDEGQNWWATATKMQIESESAPDLARATLLSKIDWSQLPDEDCELLRAALDWESDDE
jgi:Zn-dependent peptidase ImmA (M78 family)